jgi:hypothetical protein
MGAELVSRVAGPRFSIVARAFVGTSLLAAAGLLGCGAPQKPVVQPSEVEGFTPKNSKVRILRPEDVPPSGWTRTRITRSFDDTEDGTQAMLAFIKQAELAGGEALSDVEMHARLTRDGKAVLCTTQFTVTMKTENRSEPQWKPGYPPQLEYAMVTRRIWDLKQSEPKCQPTEEPAKPGAKPHEFVGTLYQAK